MVIEWFLRWAVLVCNWTAPFRVAIGRETIRMQTEDISPRFADLDRWPTGEIVEAMVDRQMAAIAAVHTAAPALVEAAEAAAAVLADGDGLLAYAGAGSSGRLAVQDGVELPPTYGWPTARLVYLLAGGEPSLLQAIEGAEDDAAQARRKVAGAGIGRGSVLIAVAASGRTPFAVAAAESARHAGALTIGIANNPDTPLLATVDHPVLLATGAEVIAGSTRMAAGTAQKAALNILSSTLMVRLGRVYANLMVDLASSNVKLDRRRIAILRRIVPVDAAAARDALAQAGGAIKPACLIALGADPATARRLLAETDGHLRPALERVAAARPGIA